ncbi:MAG: lasso RiPP family leader peptide-containing protein [Acidobacteria bacterium]|nr:lasso RiPP family leader peptide-containing protein [Acidobacteriota bacterium]
MGSRSKSPDAAASSRKRYATPRLQRYGSLAKLTRSGGSTRNEAGNPMMRRRACL